MVENNTVCTSQQSVRCLFSCMHTHREGAGAKYHPTFVVAEVRGSAAADLIQVSRHVLDLANQRTEPWGPIQLGSRGVHRFRKGVADSSFLIKYSRLSEGKEG